MEISQLRWKCRRGTKELDLLLQGYLENVYPRASAGEQTAFQELLELQDPQLSELLLYNAPAGDRAIAHVVQRIRQYA